MLHVLESKKDTVAISTDKIFTLYSYDTIKSMVSSHLFIKSTKVCEPGNQLHIQHLGAY